MNQYSTEDVARYAEGLMEPGEQAAFEQALATDASLQEALDLYREVQQGLQQQWHPDAQEKALRATLKDLGQQYFTGKTGGRVVRMKNALRAAVAVAAVAILVVFVWHPWQKDLYTQYADASMITSVERGADSASLLQMATRAFNKRDYAGALPLLQQTLLQEANNSFVQYYYGIALLETGKTAEAQQIFTKLHEGNSVFKYEATFYMALSYLKNGDRSSCRSWLQQIPADASNYGKAKELLKKL
ncbi:MAG: tetratricopeptide repeat protein [Candidatus Pseudobacter hemicellulosilyticus]|uniref:Tetratricopeptide repeat protein n=1 Tax=Candidatus Pseudobacter hemicellulosilyticus TaxID=3121375 RepID=A0AAJ6BGA0_9BACT|nr:MAG: tetratricopeptide repeat protein [Pseudobacter sp.]